MFKIIKFVMLDIINNKIMLIYTALLGLLSWGTFSLEDNSAKGMLTLLNIILLIVPLVSILFSTIYIYKSAEFIELLVSQPIRRSRIWSSLFLGLCLSFIMAFGLGAGIPLFVYAPLPLALTMTMVGILISLVFVALACLSAVLARDKAKGIGVAIMVWLYFALIFDAIVLFLLFQFSEYPIEKAMVGICATSPIDLGRILILLKMDISALMGYTGAVFNSYFGSTLGSIVSLLIMLAWVAVPFLLSLRIFNHKDL